MEAQFSSIQFPTQRWEVTPHVQTDGEGGRERGERERENLALVKIVNSYKIATCA